MLMSRAALCLTGRPRFAAFARLLYLITVTCIVASARKRPGLIPAHGRRGVHAMHRTSLQPVPRSVLMIRGGSVGGDSGVMIPAINGALRALDLFGTAVFAFSGSVAAGSRGMDIFGCTVVGMVTAVGGGTIRDALLGRLPVFWVKDTTYLHIATVTSLLTFILWPLLEDRGVRTDSWPMTVSDTLGLGAFVVIGARVALERGLEPIAAVIFAVIASTFGGVVRDILCRRPVRILHSQSTIYATPVAFGGLVYVTLHKLFESEVGDAIAAITGYLCTVSLLFAAESCGLRLPQWLKYPIPQWQLKSPPHVDFPVGLSPVRSAVQGFSLNITATDRQPDIMVETRDRQRVTSRSTAGFWGIEPLPDDVRVSRGGASHEIRGGSPTK